MAPEEFRQNRKKLGLTQKQLAQELGLAKNGDVYIRKIENGRANPSRLIIKCFSLLLLKK